MKRPAIDDGGDYAADRALEDAAAEPFRLERRPATERAALAVARLEDYAETLADPDVPAADLAVHVEALEQAAITLAAVVTAVTT